MARYSAVFVFYTRKSHSRIGTPTGGRELNLLPKEPIESFWDGLWLGIRLLLCFVFEPYTGTCGHRPSRQPLVWPGGMRVALEYLLPSATRGKHPLPQAEPSSLPQGLQPNPARVCSYRLTACPCRKDSLPSRPYFLTGPCRK